MPEGKKHLTRAQIIDVGQKLKEMIDLVPSTDGEKWCRFKTGDDGAVADEFNVSRSAVGRLRVELFGKLYFEPKPERATKQDDVSQKIAELVAYHAKVSANHTDLRAQNERLVTDNARLNSILERLISLLFEENIVDARRLMQENEDLASPVRKAA